MMKLNILILFLISYVSIDVLAFAPINRNSQALFDLSENLYINYSWMRKMTMDGLILPF